MDNDFLCLVWRGLAFGDEYGLCCGGGGGEYRCKSSILLIVGGGDGERCLAGARERTSSMVLLISPGGAGGEGERLPAYHIPLEFPSSTGSSADNNVGGVE